MKPSPSYTGPILTSLATLLAAGGACLYAVNVQKIFGGMRAERETSFELILCGFFTLFFLRVRVTIPFFVFVFFWYSRFLTYHVFLLQTRSLRHEQLRSNRRLDSIHNYKLRMARRDASFQNGVEREGAPGKPIALNPMRRNVSPWTTHKQL